MSSKVKIYAYSLLQRTRFTSLYCLICSPNVNLMKNGCKISRFFCWKSLKSCSNINNANIDKIDNDLLHLIEEKCQLSLNKMADHCFTMTTIDDYSDCLFEGVTLGLIHETRVEQICVNCSKKVFSVNYCIECICTNL